MKPEHKFQNKIVPALKRIIEPRGGIVWKHADASTSGLPDVTIWWDRAIMAEAATPVSAWEFKFTVNGSIEQTDLQHDMMKRLARVVPAFYLIDSPGTVYAARPHQIKDVTKWTTVTTKRSWLDDVVAFILEKHT